MARKPRRMESHAGELNLTAMIDIAFQMLNFFVITAHPIDVFANFDVFRPQAEKMVSEQVEEVVLPLEIIIYRDGFTFERRDLPFDVLSSRVARLAALNRQTPVIIKCTGDSSHAALVRVLDLCARTGLHKISIFSM